MPYPSSPPARLRLVAFGLHGLRSLLEELVPQFRAQAEILIVDKAYGEAVEAVQVLRQTGEIDVLVSAGSNGSYLREHLDMPVVLVHPGGFDIMGSLASAQAERKAVVTYGEMPLELMEFVQRFDLPVELRSYRSEADARSCVQDLKELGVEWVLAPGLVVDLARENQMEGVLLYSQGAVRQALESAIELARVARAEAARRDRLNTILAQLRDGVVSVDRDERIETVNPAMEAWLGQPAQAMDQCLAAGAGFVQGLALSAGSAAARQPGLRGRPHHRGAQPARCGSGRQGRNAEEVQGKARHRLLRERHDLGRRGAHVARPRPHFAATRLDRFRPRRASRMLALTRLDSGG